MMVEGKWMQAGVWNMEQLDPDPLWKIEPVCPWQVIGTRL